MTSLTFVSMFNQFYAMLESLQRPLSTRLQPRPSWENRRPYSNQCYSAKNDSDSHSLARVTEPRVLKGVSRHRARGASDQIINYLHCTLRTPHCWKKACSRFKA